MSAGEERKIYSITIDKLKKEFKLKREEAIDLIEKFKELRKGVSLHIEYEDVIDYANERKKPFSYKNEY